MAYDSVLGAMVLFGGENQVNSAGSYLNDTWLLNGTSWQQESIASPPARRSAGMAYDARAGEVILFGGYDGSTALDDTWALDAALSATSISPSLLGQGAAGVTGTITGTGFLNPVTVTVRGPGRGVHVSVLAMSPTEVSVRTSVRAGTPTGSYNVVVTNGDGAVATCVNCLTVTGGPTISSISPDTAASGQTLTVVITGTGFSQDAAVFGPKGVRFTSVAVRPDGTGLTATMKVLSTAPTGSHLPITVRNGPAGAYGAATADLLTIS